MGKGYATDYDMVDLIPHLLKVIVDGQWHSSTQLTAFVGYRIRPEHAYRASPNPGRKDPDYKTKHSDYYVQLGREILVIDELKKLTNANRIEKRLGDHRSYEWRLVDRVWVEQLLAKINAVTA